MPVNPFSIFSSFGRTKTPPPQHVDKLSDEAQKQQELLWSELRADGRALAYSQLIGFWNCSAPGHNRSCSCEPGPGRKKQELTRDLVKQFKKASRVGSSVPKEQEGKELNLTKKESLWADAWDDVRVEEVQNEDDGEEGNEERDGKGEGK